MQQFVNQIQSIPRHQTRNMSARATRRSTRQGDLVFTEDPEAITRKRGKVQYTPAPTTSTTRPQHTEAMVQTDEEQDTSTEDADFMDASAFVIETDAEYDPELNPDDDPPSDSESTRSNTSEAREVRRRYMTNEAPEDIRDFIPEPEPVGPKLPAGEWYMPDLCNTSLSTVMESGSRMENGRYLFQFPKLATYTDFDLFIIDPLTGQIYMYDIDNDITYPFSVRASRMKRKNSRVIELIKTAVRDQKIREVAKQTVPGVGMRPPADRPYTIEQLGEVLGIYEDCMEKRATIAMSIHELMLKNSRDKWATIGANEALSEKIRDKIEEIFINLGKDIGLRHQFGKATYTLPKISLRNNLIDSEASFARFGLAIQNELGEIMKQATRQPPVPVPQQVQTTQDEHNDTPTGVTSNGKTKPRKVGFSNPIHNTDINHRLNELSVDTGSPSPTGRLSRPTKDNQKKGIRPLLTVGTASTSSTGRPWRTTSDRENERRELSTPSPNGDNTISPIDTQIPAPYAPKHKDKECYRCGKIGHMSYNCVESIQCSYCNRKTHIENNCKDKRRASSTPNHTNNPTMPPTPRSNRQVSNTDTNYSILEQNQTILTQLLLKSQQKDDDESQTKDKKQRLRRIKSFDGNNKNDCITWVDQTESVAKELGISLRQAMMETAEGSVYNVLSSLGKVSDKDLSNHMIEAFSDIPTQEDAIDKLRMLRRKDEALIAFNATYIAIHRRAYECEPCDQTREPVWREYANTLDKDFANSLNYQIGRQKGIHLHTLEDVLEKAKDMEIQERKNKAYKDRKELDDSVTPTTTQTTQIKQVNEIDFDDFEEINYIQNRRPDPRFNSTMKSGYNGNTSSGYQSNSPRNSAYNNTSRSPGPNQSYRQDRHGAPVGQPRYPPNHSNNYNPNRNYQQGSVQGNSSNYNSSYNGGYNSSYNQGPPNQNGTTMGYNQGRRFIHKYRHPRGNPKDDIKFEFVDNNRYDILKTLRGILRHFEDVPAGNRAAYPSRYQGEVNEADIQEISMPELCHMMGASVDNVYEALVAGDYIEEIVNTA